MKVKFYLKPYQSPKRANYQHLAVVLAEGLKEFNIEFYGNINYWYCIKSKDYLIRTAPDNFKADVHVYTTSYFCNIGKRAAIQNDVINILLDACDGVFTEAQNPTFKNFNYVLRTHYNKYFSYPNNVRPWAFGLSERMIESCNRYIHLEKTIDILQNFRVDHPLRKHMIDHLNPILNKHCNVKEILTKPQEHIDACSYWAQTGRRHNEEYFQLLSGSKCTYVFGGDFQPKSIKLNYHYTFSRLTHRLRKKILNTLKINNKHFIYLNQFDSWRLWESLCSSTVPIHLDLSEYGCILPVMPQNWIHYLGIEDINQLEQFSDKLKALSDDELYNIAENGRQWSLKNYSPKATAKRFLLIALS